MISKESTKCLNEVMHELYVESYMLKGIEVSFSTANLKGFSSLAKNESYERWKHGSKVEYYIKNMGGKVLLPLIQEAKTNYSNPSEALTIMQNMDKAILDLIVHESKEIAERKEWYVLKCLNKIHDIMLEEYHEVSAISTKTKMVGGDQTGLICYDDILFQYYYPMIEERMEKYDG